MGTTCLIIEDEPAAAAHLISLIKKCDDSIVVVDVIDNIKSGIAWLSNNQAPALIFSDIQIADGLAFKIFESVKVSSSIIFTTAYDEYAIRAFKHNSIDYLLKPIDPKALQLSLNKFREQKQPGLIPVAELMQQLTASRRNYRKNFLVNYRDKLIPLSIDSILYFFIENGLVYAKNKEGKNYLIDSKLEEIQEQLDPENYFRANRQFLIHRDSVKEIDYYFNGRLLVSLIQPTTEKLLISKERVTQFRKWFEQTS